MEYPMILAILFIPMALTQNEFPKGFRPISAIPDEFFTCKKREPGLYADDKRSCSLYWNCSSEGAEPQHIQCPNATRFDDRVKACVESKLEKCPVDYGYFESAQSFCRGRPYPQSGDHLGPDDQSYYPVLQKNCASYYWCSNSAGNSRGLEFQCRDGEKFDDRLSVCNKEAEVSCSISYGAEIV